MPLKKSIATNFTIIGKERTNDEFQSVIFSGCEDSVNQILSIEKRFVSMNIDTVSQLFEKE
jgi:hypothetical protein